MAINWTTTLDSMRSIPGINQDKVSEWGPKLLPLVQRFFGSYREMNPDGCMSHDKQDVIEISDGEDEESGSYLFDETMDYWGENDLDYGEGAGDGESSRFFRGRGGEIDVSSRSSAPYIRKCPQS